MKPFSLFCAPAGFLLLSTSVSALRHVSITVNASAPISPLPTFSRFFGCDEPNYATLPRGEALLHELGSLSPQGQTYLRTHNLLTTGNSSLIGVPGLKFGSTNAYTISPTGEPIYNFTIIDQIFDAYLKNNVKPYVEVGFMPLALASHPDPYFFLFNAGATANNIYTGWSHVPTNYSRWEELVFRWTSHCITRYGKAEVQSWYWEIWNEPNIPYWNGTTSQFYMLHDHAVNGIRRALPSARIGGAEIAGGAAGTYLSDFLNHTLNSSTSQKLDFISFHSKGAPLFIYTNTTPTPANVNQGYVRLNVSTQLQQIDQAFSVIASFPTYKHTPIVMGEYDPDGCAACTSAAYGYRNNLMYPAYTMASFVRALDLAGSRGVNLTGALTWAFEYESTPLLDLELQAQGGTKLFDGFRVLSTQGVDKPVLNAHRVLAMMTGGQRLRASSSGQVSMKDVLADSVRNETDVGVMASTLNGTVYVLVWHYHDNLLDMPDVSVGVEIGGLRSFSGKVNVTHWRIDQQHSDAYSVWQDMGSPETPSKSEHQQLVESGKLKMLHDPTTIEVRNATVTLNFTLPIRGTSLLVLQKPQ